MATKTQNPSPIPRISRLGFGLAVKSSNPPPRNNSEKHGGDDEWYIPYSGPYEPPRELFKRKQPRDSWGDPVRGEEDVDDPALASFELHKHFGIGHGRPGDDEKVGPRARSQSGVSGRTTSSGGVDPNRASVNTRRRSTVSSQPPVPPYVALDTTRRGGVGESPMPMTHKRTPSKESHHRLSIAGIFSMGGNKASPRRNPTNLPKQIPRNGPAAGIGHSVGAHRRSVSSGSAHPPLHGNHFVNAKYTDAGHNSITISQPFNTVTPPLTSHFAKSNVIPAIKEPKPPWSPSSRYQHPYANVSPGHQVYDESHTDHHALHQAPSPTHNIHPNQPDPPRLSRHRQKKPSSAGNGQSHFPLPFAKGLMRLKNSMSTPDLRLQSRMSSNSPLSRHKGLIKTPSIFKGKERWLSPETWCDAVLFPRPRLKVKYDGDERAVGSSQNPVRQAPAEKAPAEFALKSRVLAHSTSIADLGTRVHRLPDEMPSGVRTHAMPTASGEGLRPNNGLELRPPRPISFALDDLALPTPVPSLNQCVLFFRVKSFSNQE